MNLEASKSQTVDTVCNISEHVDVEATEVVDPREDRSSDRNCRDIIPLAQPHSESLSQNYKKSQTEYIKKVSETNNSAVSSSAATEVSSFYHISYCSKV